MPLLLPLNCRPFFRRLFAEGAFNASFVPLFAGILATKGKKEARTFAVKRILTLWVGVLFLLILCIELCLPTLIPLLVPGFITTPERLFYAIEFSRITFPFIFFISITALYSGILNSFDKFAIVASSPLIGNVLIVAIVASFYNRLFSSAYAFPVPLLAMGMLSAFIGLISSLKEGMGLRFVGLALMKIQNISLKF